ncbi:MAG: carboxylate-amine ligase [Alphaproteobacteria bacterium]
MMTDAPSLTLGIEEEYLLVDRQTGALVAKPPQSMFKECQDQLDGQVMPEFLRCQIEVGTTVCKTISEARAELGHLRKVVNKVAASHDMAIISASTHPFGEAEDQRFTQKQRYQDLARDLGEPMRRMMICGLHVHAGIEDKDLRIELMNQVRYFLPHLLCLSTSSPFWQGRDTMLDSYRLAVFRELPRTGLPEQFASWRDYQRNVQSLVEVGALEDATKIWWPIRPSDRFPTVELRVADACTRLDDTMTIAALYLCLMRRLYRMGGDNLTWRPYSNLQIEQNLWQAQHDGMKNGLIDFSRGTIAPMKDLVEELLELVAEDAEALDCVAEVENARTIVKRGTSAQCQRKIYADAIAAGDDEDQALRKVAHWLIMETAAYL